jgi:glycosyltransferase involved in cell wall biosynthesis
MRLCYLGSANSIHTQRWIKYFAEKGHETHLISYEPGIIDNVKMYVLPERKNRYFSLISRYFEVKKLVKNIKPDLVHAHYIGGYGWLGALTGSHPFVASAWGSDILAEPKVSRISCLLTKFTLGRADILLCDGNNLKDGMTQLGADAEKIRIIFFGTDTQKFRPEQRDEKLRKELFNSNSQIVISTRNLEPIYDVETLVNAVPLILKKLPETKFIIVGSGSEKEHLMGLAKSSGVLNSIKFVGRIPNVELPKYIASSDVYVSTSLSDGGLAASTSEAMACELPVVITDFGMNRMWVKDGVNGFIFPTKNPESLAEKTIYLLENKDIRIKFGKINRKIIQNRNDYYKEMNKIENVYKELVEAYKP